MPAMAAASPCRRAAPTAASTATTIRCRWCRSSARSACWRRSTPMCAPRTRACARSWPPSPASAQAVQILRPARHARRRHPPAGAARHQRRRRRGRPPGDRQLRTPAAAPAMTSISTPRPGSRPPTRRCARRSSISARSRRRPAAMPVVLGSGWPGILLHEAIGHGLEGDFNRKKTSAFAGLMGQRVACQGRHRGRRRHPPRPPRLAHHRRRGHADPITPR